jgi:hypothetical protein
MRSVLGNLSWARTLGVYLAEGHLTLTETAATLLGRKVLRTACVPIDEGGPGKTLGQWLLANLKPRQRRRTAVCIGLAPEQTFFATRTFEDSSQEAPTAAALLAASGNGSLDETSAAADSVRSKLRRTTIYSIAACRRGLAEELSRVLKESGIENGRLEPAPCSVLEVADRSAKPPHAWKVLVRALVGENGGIAMLVVNGKPMLWRRFALAAGQEAVNIASAVRHVEVHAMANLGVRDVAGLFIQGKLEDPLIERLRQELSIEVAAAKGAGPDEATYSLAMALSACKKDQDRIDLFRSIRPPPTLGQVFPRRMAAGMVVAAAAMAAILWYNLSDLQEEHRGLNTQNASFKWAQGMRTEAISAERKNLSAEVDAVQKFLGTRVIWSNYLRDLPTRLPSNACLQSFVGQYELKNSAKKATQKPNQSLTICGMARFTDRGSAPKEIDAFLESLRGAEALKRTFPIVHLAEIKWRKDAAADIALFTIIAMPADKSGGKEEAEDKPAASGKDKSPAHG